MGAVAVALAVVAAAVVLPDDEMAVVFDVFAVVAELDAAEAGCLPRQPRAQELIVWDGLVLGFCRCRYFCRCCCCCCLFLQRWRFLKS